ncbi:MAG: hypothetical protein ACRDK5_02710 [Solirubrobacterales bacterium]
MDRPAKASLAAKGPAALFLAVVVLAAASLTAAAVPSFGETPVPDAAVQPRGGKYKGKTSQASVEGAFRKIVFKVKGRRITLKTEPVIRHGFCLSPPVFVEEGAPPVTKKISRNGTFSFDRTFEGSRINRIRGTFVDDHTIEGTARYYFPDSASGQCVAGKETPSFRAKR